MDFSIHLNLSLVLFFVTVLPSVKAIAVRGWKAKNNEDFNAFLRTFFL